MFERRAIGKIKALLIVSVLIICAAGSLPGIHADANGDELIVELRQGANGNTIAQRYNLLVLGSINDHGKYTYLMKNLSIRPIADVIRNLSVDPDVAHVEQNDSSTVAEINGLGQRAVMWIDGGCGQGVADQAALIRIRVPQAHQITTGGGVIVAVIDTGLDYSAGLNAVPGYDFVDNDSDPSDVASGPASGHGTMVASLILAVAPGAQIMPLRAFNPSGTTSAFRIAQAIDYARQHGASVINMSFSYDQPLKVVDDALARAEQAGLVLVAAAGNDSSDRQHFPANSGHVLSIGAVDSSDVIANFSNTGHLDVCAPGVGLDTKSLHSSCALVDGTSFSAALVSGEAALLVAAGHGRPADDIKTYAVRIDTIPQNHNVGLGPRIDCYAAVTRTNP